MTTNYAARYEQVFRAIKTNHQRLDGNQFATKVVLVHERGKQIRPADVGGSVIKITDKIEVPTYFPTRFVDSQFDYTVEGFLFEPDADKLRLALRQFVADCVEVFNDDIYLAAADLANGGSGDKLVKMHRHDRTTREYVAPEGYFRMEFHGTFSWQSGIPG